MDLFGFVAVALGVAAVILIGGRWRSQGVRAHDPSLPRTPRERLIAAIGFSLMAAVAVVGLLLSRA